MWDVSTIPSRNPEISQPNLEQLLGGKFNSLLEHRHLAARIRQRTSPRAAAVALEALLRRDEFEPLARLQLFADLAAHFRYLVEFPIAAKQPVLGPQAHPFYRWVAETLGEGAVPRWNFHKYLIGRDGYIADVFPESVEPSDTRIRTAIGRSLADS